MGKLIGNLFWVLLILYFIGSCTSSGDDSSSSSSSSSGGCDYSAWSKAKSIIESQLKNPSSADFPFCDEYFFTVSSDGTIKVRAYVEAENSYGQEVRTNFMVRFWNGDLNDYDYELYE